MSQNDSSNVISFEEAQKDVSYNKYLTEKINKVSEENRQLSIKLAQLELRIATLQSGFKIIAGRIAG